MILCLIVIVPLSAIGDLQNNLDITGGPDCINCHDTGGISNKTINIAYLNSTVHRNLNFDAIVSPGLRADNRICWGCHQSDGTQPVDHPDRTTNPYGCIACHGRDSDIQPPHVGTSASYPAPRTGQEIEDGYNLGGAPVGQNMTHKKDTCVAFNQNPFKTNNQEVYMFSRHADPFQPGRYPGTGNRINEPDRICISCHAKKIRDHGQYKEDQWTTYAYCGVGCHDLWKNYSTIPLPTSHEISVTKCTDCHSLLVGFTSDAHNRPLEFFPPPDYYFNIVFIGEDIGSSVHGRLVNNTPTGIPTNNSGCIICHTDANFTINYSVNPIKITINQDSKSHLWNSEPYCTKCHALPGETTLSGPGIPSRSFHNTIAKGNNSACLECHGGTKRDHNIIGIGGIDCISCHSPGDVNVSILGKHANLNTSDGEGNVTNNDCWTCHYQKDMNRSNVYLCEACHSTYGGIVPITNSSLIMNDIMHGTTSCKVCHAPSGYHQQGTVGPLGLVEKILRKII